MTSERGAECFSSVILALTRGHRHRVNLNVESIVWSMDVTYERCGGVVRII